ncbi:MAG: hypothetical protein LW688_06745 [Cryomorphaceae bacterium]|nr:hypothetical protein [Cryomorphaceae bacterium]
MNFIFLHSSEQLSEYDYLLKEAQLAYQDAFPDFEEREDWKAIIHRIEGLLASGEPSTVMFLTETENHFAACIIADWYEASNFLHVTYLFTNPLHQKKGFGRQMMETHIFDGIQQLNKHYQTTIEDIILESNIPWKTGKDSMDPSTRLRFFDSLGVQWIPLSYVQPSLHKGQVHTENLFLLHYSKSKKTKVQSTELKTFLHYFYVGLGVSEPLNDPFYAKMIQQIESQEYLFMKPIPTEETNFLKLTKCSVCYHFIDDTTDTEEVQGTICQFLNSYERDLLSYKYQKATPFRSSFVAKTSIRIYFPEYYEYTSEGTLYVKHSERNVVSGFVHFNKSILPTNKTVWSVIISCDSEEGFFENEFIKLIQYFGSSQENSNVKEQIRFSVDKDENLLEMDQLLLFLTGQQCQPCSSGIVQVDANFIQMRSGENIESTVLQLVKNLNKLNSGESKLVDEFEIEYCKDDEFSYLTNTFIGFLLGIFDYNRMGFDEILDTFIPIRSSESFFIALNRGVLIQINHDNEMYLASLENTGISAYLMVPHMALVYNEHLIQNAAELLSGTLQKNNDQGINIAKLRDARKQAERLINDDFLPASLFQYPTEQKIFEHTLKQRGINDTIEEVKNKMELIDLAIHEKETERETNHELFMTILLTLISCFQFESIFESISEGNKLMTWIYTIAFSFTVTGTIYYINRLKQKN